jgi:hypothetical protein
MWGRRRAGAIVDPKTEMVEVDQCLAVLKASEAQFVHFSSGLRCLNRSIVQMATSGAHVVCAIQCVRTVADMSDYRDVLSVLASVNNVPLPAVASTAAHKRYREQEEHEERSTHCVTDLGELSKAAEQPLAQREMASRQRAHAGETVPQPSPSAFRIPTGATALDAFREGSQPVASPSTNAPVGEFFAPEPGPSAWAQLLDFNQPRHNPTNRPLAAADGAYDTGIAAAAAAELMPPPVDPGEQLAAWLAYANPDDVARSISGGHYAPTPGSFGTEVLDAYEAPMSAPVLAQPVVGGVRLDGHQPLPVWPQELSGFQ